MTEFTFDFAFRVLGFEGFAFVEELFAFGERDEQFGAALWVDEESDGDDGVATLIDTVDGPVIYEVKPGTATDTRVRLRGKGVPSLRNKDIRGDHYVTLVVQVPTKLSSEANNLLKKFDAADMDSLGAVERFRAEKKDGTGDDKDKGKKKKKKFFDL